MPFFSRTRPVISRTMSRWFGLFAALFLTVFSALPAAAHPHVFVTVKSTIVYENGVPKAVRHAWRFDDMFSAFAVQGLDTDTDGNLSRSELQSLAEVNVTSLKEFDFFTFGKAGSGDLTFAQPVDYWLDHDGKALTLNFTLPVKSSVNADTTRIEIYDPSYFVAFSLAEENPVSLEGAPAGCRVDAEGPDNASSDKLTEDFFSNLDPEQGWGEQFANSFVVRCGEAAVAFANQQQQKAEAEAAAAQPPPAPENALSRVETALKIAEAQPLQEMQQQPVKAQDNKALGAFGVVPPETVAANASSNSFFAWIARQQSTFYKAMSDALSASKDNGSALLLLAALAFSYGVFHAAGPGHGKAVISSYLLATGETLKRGIAISFAAAIAQAIMAILVVGIFAMVLGVTSQAMGVATWWLEAASYVLIVLLGIGVIFRRSLIPFRSKHVHDENCDHSHGPRVEDLDGEFGWRRAGAAVLAVGLRPCTGALLILVFALAQGLIWTGIAATFAMAIGTAFTVAAIATLAVTAKELAVKLAAGSSTMRTRRALRLVEITAGFAVLAFGLILLGGLMQGGVPAAAAG
jgi:nickel/cobalt transporter (NicO) family protein